MNSKKLILPTVLLSGFAAAFAIAHRRENITIGSLAYDTHRNPSKKNSRIYLRENNRYIPYLVLTNHYTEDNYALLLREEPIPVPVQYGSNNDYDDSEIDQFFENIYLPSLGWEVHTAMEEVVLLSQFNSQAKLQRQAFILTAEEMGLTDCNEFSSALEYFTKPAHRLAYVNGKPVDLWTRTPGNTPSTAVVVTSAGTLEKDDTRNHHHIRPALCLSKQVPFYSHSDIFPGVKIRTLTQSEKGGFLHVGK